MLVKVKDLDGYNLLLSIQRNTQRTEIIMSYSSSIEIPNYFECFALRTLRVFNTIFTHLYTLFRFTDLKLSLRIFTHCYLRICNCLYASLYIA